MRFPYSDSPSLFAAANADAACERKCITIEFDGGTPCNVPQRGYGIGYGSYRLNGGAVVRVDHQRPMSCNEAEIYTLIRAIEAAKAESGAAPLSLTIRGDSQIALKWARGKTESGKPAKMGKGVAANFREAVRRLSDALQGIEVTAIWHGRENSVAAFGH